MRASPENAGAIEVDIKVSGMVCDGCSGRIADALKVLWRALA
jgi:hypothetical protein